MSQHQAAAFDETPLTVTLAVSMLKRCLQAQLAQPLLAGLGQLLSMLTSCTTGLALLHSDLAVASAVMEALDPGTTQLPFQGQPSLQAAPR